MILESKDIYLPPRSISLTGFLSLGMGQVYGPSGTMASNLSKTSSGRMDWELSRRCPRNAHVDPRKPRRNRNVDRLNSRNPAKQRYQIRQQTCLLQQECINTIEVKHENFSPLLQTTSLWVAISFCFLLLYFNYSCCN